jgi:hypothetical protein
MIHKNADKFPILLNQIEEVGEEEAHKLWQIRRNQNAGWVDCTEHNLLFQPDAYYRLKPKTRTINGMEYPEPLWEKTAENKKIYIVFFNTYENVNSLFVEEMFYKQGRIQATEEGAKQMLAALQNALSGDNKQ